jgi:hypothetical protein
MQATHPIRILIYLAVLLTLFADPAPAKACSCMADVTIADNFATQDAAFTGRAVRIVDNYAPPYSSADFLLDKLGSSDTFFTYFIHNNRRDLGFSVFFKVFDSWKGIGTSYIEVNTGRGDGDCGYSFRLKREYLIYANRAYGIPGNYWVTSTCSGNSPLSVSTEDLSYLNTFPMLPLKSTLPILWTERDTVISALLLTPIAAIIGIKRRRLQKRQLLI